MTSAANPTPSPTQSVQVDLVLTPAVVSVGVEETFELKIQVQAGTQMVDSVSTYLNFDPAVLEVLSITPGTALDTVLQNEFDNNTGEIDFVAGTLSDSPSGTFRLATVLFEAVGGSPGSSVLFSTAVPRESDAAFDGVSVLAQTEDGVVTVGDTIAGALNLQGRPSPPAPSWSIPLTLSLMISGQVTPAYVFTPTTNQNGTFGVSGVPAGTYDVTVKNHHTLQNTQSVTVVDGTNNIDFGTLREGDANDDNFVTLLDFSILATAFGTGEEDTGFDPRSDFNEDGFITLLDFSLLASNFGQAGDTLQASAIQSDPKMQADSLTGWADHATTDDEVILAVVPPTRTLEAGQIFTLTLQVQAGTQQVDGASAYLDFDPTVLEVITTTAGPALTMPLQNDFDNEAGEIDYARVALGCTPPNCPTGTFKLADVMFEMVGGPDTSLSFNHTKPRNSDVTFGGVSTLDRKENGFVTSCFDLDGSAVGSTDIQKIVSRWRLTADSPNPDGDLDTPNYEVEYDLVFDGVIDVRDIASAVKHWGESCSP